MSTDRKYCRKCGTAAAADTRFCPNCGWEFTLPQQAAQKTVRFCRNCGKEVPAGAKFCGSCGFRFPEPQPAPRTAASPASPAPPAPRTAAPPAPPAPRTERREPAPAPKKGGRRGLALFLVLVLLAGLAYTGFRDPGFLVKEKTPGTPKPLPSASAAAVSAPDPGKPENVQKGSIDPEKHSVTLCGVTVDADPAMLGSGSREVSVSVYGGGTAEDGSPCDLYELSMGSGSFDRPVEVTFPCRVSPDTDVTVEHFVDGAWVPLLSFVDEGAGTVSACFESFSPARVTYRPVGVNPSLYAVKTDEDDPWVQTLEPVSNCWSILRRTNPALYGPEVERFIDDPANYALPSPKLDPSMDLNMAYDSYMKANGIWGFVDPLINIGIEALPPQSKSRVVSFMIDHSGKLSNAMNAIPFITMAVQLAYDLRNGDLNSLEPAGVNLYKNLVSASGTIYSMVTGYSHLGFTLAFLGVSIFGMELDYFVDAAKEAQAENIRDVYKAYYRDVEPFDDEHWYKVFEDAYWNCGYDPDRAMKKVKDAVDAYCGKFWTEVYKDTNEDLIFAAADANYKNVFMNATAEQKQALTEQQKREVWQLIETKAMKKIQRFLFARLQEETLEHLDQIVRPYNLNLFITIQESVDQESSGTAQYAGCTLAFGTGGEPLPGWSRTIPADEAYADGWSTEFRCTVYGYMRMGMPNQLLVYASEEDLAAGAKPLLTKDFAPEMEGNRETVIELGSVGGLPAWLNGVWRSDKGSSGYARRFEVLNDHIIRETELVIGKASDGNPVEETRDSYDREYYVDENGAVFIRRYMLGRPSYFDPDEEAYLLSMRIPRPQSPDTILITTSPKELEGGDESENNTTYYRRDPQ